MMENTGKNHYIAAIISLLVAIIGWILFIIKFPTFITLVLEVFAFFLVPKFDVQEKGRIVGILSKIVSAAFLILVIFGFALGIVSAFMIK